VFKDIFLYLSYSKSLSFIPVLVQHMIQTCPLTLVPVQYL